MAFNFFKKKGGKQEPQEELPQTPEETPVEPAAPVSPEPPVRETPQPETETAPAEAPEPQPEETPAEPAEPVMTVEQVKALQDALNRTYPGLTMLARDVNLTYEQAAKYEVGMIIREKAHVDASRRVMGMVTSHRYAILSNHMEEPTAEELKIGPNWGMRVAKPDSHFKVLGKHTYQGKTVIFLLHLPDDDTWKLFVNTVIDSDAELIRKCIARFEAKCMKPPVPDLAMPNWQDRCQFPLGMDNEGNLFPLEDPVEETPEMPAEPETETEEF